MTRGRRRGGGATDAAGWLLADVTLALMLVALGTAADGTPPDPPPAPEPAPAAAVAPAPPPPAGVDPVPVTLTVKAAADPLLAGDPAELQRLQGLLADQLAGPIAQGRKAAIVLAFGTSPDWAEGSRIARAFTPALTASAPALFEGATSRPFLSVSADPAERGLIELEIYLLR